MSLCKAHAHMRSTEDEVGAKSRPCFRSRVMPPGMCATNARQERMACLISDSMILEKADPKNGDLFVEIDDVKIYKAVPVCRHIVDCRDDPGKRGNCTKKAKASKTSSENVHETSSSHRSEIRLKHTNGGRTFCIAMGNAHTVACHLATIYGSRYNALQRQIASQEQYHCRGIYSASVHYDRKTTTIDD